MSQINDLELAVRAIEDIITELPTDKLQKWKGIFTTALIKIETELNSTAIHTCDLCGFQEYGYRLELPAHWYKRKDLTICFKHERNKIDPPLTTKEPEPVDTEATLEELMAMI